MQAPESFFQATSSKTSPQQSSEHVVFCDFDGPIVDVSERYYRAYRKGLLAIADICWQQHSVALTMKPLPKSLFWQQKQSRVADIELALCSGIPAKWFELYMQQIEALVNHDSLLRWDNVQPSAEAALSYLKQANMRLVLVTLRHSRQVNVFLRAKGLAHLVDAVYGASTVEAAHRNRVELKRELLMTAVVEQQAQGYCTSQSWMVGDTEADVLAAKEIGLCSVALSCGVRSEAYLRSLKPTKLCSELFTAAQAVVEKTALQAA